MKPKESIRVKQNEHGLRGQKALGQIQFLPVIILAWVKLLTSLVPSSLIEKMNMIISTPLATVKIK